MGDVERNKGVEKDLVREPAAWTEEIAVGGRHLLNLVQRLAAQGNVRRLRILKPDGRVFFETSLTAGVTVAGLFTILAPTLTALGAMAALLTEFRVKILRVGGRPRS
ncbi:MAG: DUF4342 domain-containing protein [Chromatiaceae bacterium]|jgi:hypothetical protein